MNLRIMFLVILPFLSLFCSTESMRSHNFEFLHQNMSAVSNPVKSSIVLPLTGQIYSNHGEFLASIHIGNPAKAYKLHVDTGSDLTWVQCNAPCKHCKAPIKDQYNPTNGKITCSDRLCYAYTYPKDPECPKPTDPCYYDEHYLEESYTRGYLVKDQFPFTLLNKSNVKPGLAFGCGDDNNEDNTASVGTLGLGRGKIGILTQLSAAGFINNAVGHCLSHRGGGYLFLGDDLIPPIGTTWVPLIRSNHIYIAGPVELLYNGKPTGEISSKVAFDCGTTYSYFHSEMYKTASKLIIDNLVDKGLRAVEQETGFCWKGDKPFKSINDVKHLFKPLSLKFKEKRGIQFQIPPENYLIIYKATVCLGILEEKKPRKSYQDIIGAISMQGIKMIYHNERQQLGWVNSGDCALETNPMT